MPVTIKEFEINTSVAEGESVHPDAAKVDVETIKRELLEACAEMIRQSQTRQNTR